MCFSCAFDSNCCTKKCQDTFVVVVAAADDDDNDVVDGYDVMQESISSGKLL